jgi:GTPase SAR1 family protein
MSQESRSQTRISFLTDIPAENDILDYHAYRDALVSIIDGLDSRAPLTVSVFGEWGSGKTTLLQMVREELKNRDVPTIWVNVWQFGNEEDVWSAFLQSILLKVKQETPWVKRLLFSFGLLRRQIKWNEVGKRVPEFLFRVLIVIVPLFISLTFRAKADQSVSSTVTVGAGTILSAVLGWLLVFQPYVNAVRSRVKVDLKGLVRSSKLRERISLLDQFKTDFEDMIVSLVGREGRLVIFVDDLDRCQPDRIVQVLDAIKLFLDTPRCVYLIGLDRDIVEQAIKVKFKDYRQPETEAREYLEKIIGLPFDLPPLSGDQMSLLVKSLASDLPDAERSTEVFALGQEPNPRKVKRTINMFLLLWALAQGRKELRGVIKPTRLAKIVVIQHSYRQLYLLLTASPGGLGELEVYFRGSGSGDVAELPEYLKPFAADSNLNRLLTLHPGDETAAEANFSVLRAGKHTPVPEEEINSYIRLTRAVTRDQPATVSQRAFVGRQKEIDTFLRILSGEKHAKALLIMGAGGMGKTALLEKYRQLCGERSIPAARIDFALTDFQSEDEFSRWIADTISTSLGLAASVSRSVYLEELNSMHRTVLMFDNYERLHESLRQWFVEYFISHVAEANLENITIVIAGRIVPELSNFGELVEKIELTEFSPEDTLQYLKQLKVEVPEDIGQELYRVTKGNPVLMSALAEQWRASASSEGKHMPPA